MQRVRRGENVLKFEIWKLVAGFRQKEFLNIVWCWTELSTAFKPDGKIPQLTFGLFYQKKTGARGYTSLTMIQGSPGSLPEGSARRGVSTTRQLSSPGYEL